MSEVSRFDDDVVRAIVGHMNVDHVDDTLQICGSLGVEGAESARMVDFDTEGADFEATVNGKTVPVRVPWRQRISERAEVRAEIVWLYEQAASGS